MMLRIALFEIRKRLRWISTYVYFGMFLALAFLLMLVAGGTFKGAAAGFGSGGKVLANAPYALTMFISSISYFGVIVIAALTGQAVHQDFETNSYALFFTSPIKRTAYLGGRLLGAMALLVFIFSSIALGLWLGSLMPFMEPTMVGPNQALAYVQPYLIAVLPNLLFTGAIFFTMATLTRKMFPVYVSSVVLLLGYMIAINLTSQLENKTLASLVDPFGITAMETLTQYWTVAERNTRLVPLSGVYLWNRLLWVGVGLAFLALTFARFRFAHASGAEGSRNRAPEELPEVGPGTIPTLAVTPPRPLSLLPKMAWLNFKETVKNVYFVVIVLAGVLFMAVASQGLMSMYGTSVYPVTHSVLSMVGGAFSLFVIIITTFYSGELVWRERDARTDQLFDALPLPTWLPFLSKLFALIMVQMVLMAVVMVTGLVIQALHGYYNFELDLYAKELFGLKLLRFSMVAVLALTVQSVVQNKYLGYFLMVLYYMVNAMARVLGFEHNLYRYPGTPTTTYSDMNGYGHFLQSALAFNVYWAAFAVLLAVVSRLFWARGMEQSQRGRLTQARVQLSPALKALSAGAALVFVGMGGYIFYNTNVLNKYRTSSDTQELQAGYEKKYKALENVPQPRITALKLAVDLFPEGRAMRMKGTYQLVNKTDKPIPAVLVRVPEDARIHKLAVGSVAQATKEDRLYELLTYELPAPLQPGQSVPLELDLEYRVVGFENETEHDDLVYNGTFVDSRYLPGLGYNPQAELSADDDRRKHGLEPKERMADVNDPEARKNTYLNRDSDWVTFEATVSTSPDQIAITPGYLQREWTENGRRYFEYKAEGKLLNFFSFLSARYAVKRDKWNDVNIEIYYHPGHEYNLDRMVEGVKASLEYFTRNFSPYQHRQVRILEFPRYRTFAQSFANTIPFSEAIGFIAKVDPKDEKDLDYPYYVTSHEVAHQWWAHQVIGGNVQGATVLSETLSQYSALMVMKQKYGADKMKRFLRYELDRYLISRGLERKKELPLARVENQPYIHYQKGSLVMYALQDYVGEDKVNQALAEYIKQVGFQEPPYTNTTELIAQLRKVTPQDLQYLIDDLFEHITLYENRAVSAKATPKDGGYEVKLTVAAKKLRADELGKEQEVGVDDVVDIGVLDDKGGVLLLEKRRVKAGEQELVVSVKQKPAKAGIDPLNKLIDRQPDDNVIAVQTE
ncbi:MAG TPA: M1 family aminopeptidase [Myxococcaceae bacterium]|nr:M1 family aminopeptidase [Myxococcaceae bacterium]